MRGDWSSDGLGKHTFRSEEGAVLNWWENKGTLQFQGRPDAANSLEEAVSGVLDEEMPLDGSDGYNQPTYTKPRQIFIVHGHDTDARDQLELVLHRLDLEPFVLMNTSGGGKTIIEALEGEIGRDFGSDFGIVLMTPDDFGYSKNHGPEEAEPRARQNVILETGMLLSSLTRQRMALIVKGHLELPSDLQGLIRLGYNDHVREIVPKLCDRLREAGFELDPKAVSHASA